jgi:hypothetical protein
LYQYSIRLAGKGIRRLAQNEKMNAILHSETRHKRSFVLSLAEDEADLFSTNAAGQT